ncbi:MAG: cyclic nucleotide-binding domain-containing protein [Desulfitobacteriaceae bacterium]
MADERMDKIYVLAKVSFLSDLTTEELNELAEDFYWESYAPGTDIIRQGEQCTKFYVLARGLAEALVTKEGRNSWQINSFSVGDAFGEISLFTGEAAPTTIRCKEECRILVLDAEHFARMMVRWPKMYQRFVEKLSQSLNRINNIVWDTKHKDFLRSALQLTQNEDKYYGLWGSVRTTKEVENKLSELSQNAGNVLLIGERGTGRQMFAWLVHKRRYGEAAPFVVMDGRRFDRQWGDQIIDNNLLDVAEGGTLFIREINLISPRAQLRLAQSMQSYRGHCLLVGTLQASPELLEQKLVPELRGCFTQGYEITPLRERKRDIPILAQGILEKLAGQYHRDIPALNTEATKLLLSHNYRQGNVTELIQVMERAFFLAEDAVIGLEHIFFGPAAEKIGRTINLFSWRPIENVFKQGNLVLGLQRSAAGIFALILLFLLLVPSTRMAGVIFTLVWGLWWPALTVISPFLGRVWCTACPFSFIMEQVQKKWHWNRSVPDILKKYSYLAVTFLFLLIFWVEIVSEMHSHPGSTAILLLVVLAAAVVTGVVFQRHAWCNYLCPLGGFVGMASIGALLEIRSDAAVCLNKCTTADCYRGNGTIPGCPMSQHLPYMDNNLACKLCFNCVRSCPNGAVKFNLRIPAREIWHLVRVNQGYAVFIGVSLAILIPINYFEPLQALWPLGLWRLWFSLAYWGAAVMAGISFWYIARPFKTKGASRRVKLTFALIPLVISGHIIYQLHFVPGATFLMFGLGWLTTGGEIQFASVPAYLVGQVTAAAIGLALSGFTIALVLLHSRKKQTEHPPLVR